MKILVAPMDWGLGHATRCVPLIRALLKNGAEVILAGDGRSGQYLQHVFPELRFYTLPSYNIRYTNTNWQVPYLCLQIPALLLTFRKEKKVLDTIIIKEGIDRVISDNRYGVYSETIPSVFITHQTAPIAPFRWIGYRLHLSFMKKFSQVWIPDFQEPPFLSGGLSHDFPHPSHARFIGPLSRFAGFEAVPDTDSDFWDSFDMVAVLSGVEPQRTLIEKGLTEAFKAFPEKKACIIQGKPELTEKRTEKNVYIQSFAGDEILYRLLTNSKVVISRGGYSSLMDFAELGVQKIILIPTPGQTEQEYLAQHFTANKIATFTPQSAMNLAKALDDVENCIGFPKRKGYDINQMITEWLSEETAAKIN